MNPRVVWRHFHESLREGLPSEVVAYHRRHSGEGQKSSVVRIHGRDMDRAGHIRCMTKPDQSINQP
jgi:ribosomal protein L35AE/L33A